MTWIYYAALAISAYFAVKKSAPPETGQELFTDIDLPTTEAGKEIPVLFGTRDFDAMLITWYGDVELIPIRKKGGKK